MKRRILIISTKEDFHALAVMWGVEKLGGCITHWTWDEFPLNDTCGLELGSNELSDNSFLKLNGERYFGYFDVIWVRRYADPLTKEATHELDKEFAFKESKTFLHDLLPYVASKDCLWVSHPENLHFASNKIKQLLLARRVGFNIPHTFFGNSFVKVKEFYESMRGNIIFKSFEKNRWVNSDNSIVYARTSKVEPQQLENPFSIEACPGIYQEYIEKKYELRVTVIGSNVFAAKINASTVDWRFDTNHAKNCLSIVEVPLEISQACLALCCELGLNFAAIDLAVDSEDKYVFFELNPAGQFLWIDEYCHESRLLSEFCGYLAHVNTETNRFTYRDFLDSIVMTQYLLNSDR